MEKIPLHHLKQLIGNYGKKTKQIFSNGKIPYSFFFFMVAFIVKCELYYMGIVIITTNNIVQHLNHH